VNVNITVGERQLIREYVATCSENDNHHNQGNRGKDKHAGKHRGNGKDKPLPPGLARKVARGETLPPGWQKKVVKGEILPVEVYRECHPLPSEVVVKLPPPPAGTVLVTIEGKVVRLLQATREILDVFEVHG